MTEATRGNASFYLATVFLRQLYGSGIRHIVLSPGSRSTPLTLAAAAFPGLSKHVVLDERSAAFTALGIGKATGLPAVLICTSGTATANYYPAVIEAKQSGVPLLLATADRPAHLRNTDANQTIDQLELYGKFVCRFENIAAIDDSEKTSDSLKEKAAEALKVALEHPGPVHFNFPFDKPLEPEAAFLQKIEKENEAFTQATQQLSEELHKKNIEFQFPDAVRASIQKSKKPLVIVGQLPVNREASSIFDFACAIGAPILSEQGAGESNMAIQGFEGFLRNEATARKLQPDLILRFGLQPASKSLLLAMKSWEAATHIYVTSSSAPRKTALPVTETLLWDGSPFPLTDYSRSGKSWLDDWRKQQGRYNARKAAAFNKQKNLTDGHVYEHLSNQISPDWFLFFSNSFPARDRSMFGNWRAEELYTNRGASGIDGISSTAIGISIGSGRPGILFTGDLAFLHDTNALLNRRLPEQPLLIVVINNRGGSIFRMLPIAEYRDYFNRYFETPQEVDLEKLAGSYGLPYRKISTIRQLETLDISEFIENTGHGKKLHILEFQTDPDSSVELRNHLWGGS